VLHLIFIAKFASSYASLKNFSHNNRTQGHMEKSQQELKRTRLQNRRLKKLAEIAAVYNKSISGQIREYDDGFSSKAKQIFTKNKKRYII